MNYYCFISILINIYYTLNHKIKNEHEISYNKRIKFYKENFEEYKLKLKTLFLKINKIFPNTFFQIKIIRKLKKIKNIIIMLKI